MIKTINTLAAFFLLALIAACGHTGSSFNLAATKDSIVADNKQFIADMQRGDSVAMAAHYTADAWIMPANAESIKGRNNIINAWGATVQMGVRSFDLNTEDVAGSDSLLAETGNYKTWGNNKELLDQGKYVAVWKPEGGKWKIYRLISTTSLPPR